MPLGVLPVRRLTAGEAVIKPGSTVLLYTDGLVEERGSRSTTASERLRAAIERAPDGPDAMCDFLLDEVPPTAPRATTWRSRHPARAGGHDQVELRLPAEPDRLALMRRALERWLAAVGRAGGDAYELKVACGEACMNAVEHAYPPGDAVFVVRALNLGGRWRSRCATSASGARRAGAAIAAADSS